MLPPLVFSIFPICNEYFQVHYFLNAFRMNNVLSSLAKNYAIVSFPE